MSAFRAAVGDEDHAAEGGAFVFGGGVDGDGEAALAAVGEHGAALELAEIVERAFAGLAGEQEDLGDEAASERSLFRWSAV